MTVRELAPRAGVSRDLVQRVERGHMGSAIGAVFETAAIVGVRLFDPDPDALSSRIAEKQRTLTLLPQTVRRLTKAVKDDF